MRIGKFSDVMIKINRWFIFLLMLFCFAGLLQQVCVAFVSVLIHEVTHVIVARHVGVKVHEIELFPFGGVAKFDRLDEASRLNQFMIFIAGPCISLILAGIIFVIDVGYNHVLLKQLFEINLMLGWFNLIIASPLDGGRIFHILLSGAIGYRQAGKITIFMSKLISIGLLILFVYDFVCLKVVNFSMLCAAMFIFIIASKESRYLQYDLLKARIRKRNIVTNDGCVKALTYTALHLVQARDIIKCLVHAQYHLIFVIDGAHNLLGTLTEVEIWEALAQNNSCITLGDILKFKQQDDDASNVL